MSESTSSSHVYCIDPLQGAENYAVWKIKMMDMLTDQGYMDIVDGSEILLPTVEAEAKLWRKKDRAALSIIRLTLMGGCIPRPAWCSIVCVNCLPTGIVLVPPHLPWSYSDTFFVLDWDHQRVEFFYKARYDVPFLSFQPLSDMDVAVAPHWHCHNLNVNMRPPPSGTTNNEQWGLEMCLHLEPSVCFLLFFILLHY